MTQLQELERRGKEAVKRLRITSLQQGQSFLIQINKLPKGHVYREYPDGTIKLEKLESGNSRFITVEILGATQSEAIRQQFLANLD